MNKKTIEDIDVNGKKVLVRCDFNVPLDENKNITSDNRIVAALPTINKLINENSLKGLFVKELFEKINNEQNEENKKILENALEIGLNVLDK